MYLLVNGGGTPHTNQEMQRAQKIIPYFPVEQRFDGA
jgi:hypothetical protein